MLITDFWRQMVGPHEPVSKEFEHMLMREVMRTELLRVKSLIIVAIVIMFNISCVRVFFPGVEERIWRGTNPNTIYLILTCFILFEWWCRLFPEGYRYRPIYVTRDARTGAVPEPENGPVR